MTLFGAAALLLTIVGTYAVVSHSVSLRRREIGIRIALGGSPKRIQAMMLRQSGVAAVAGVAGGAVAARMLSRVLAASLHGVDPVGLPTLAAVALVLVSATLLAFYFPSSKAAGVDPSIALRTEG